VYAPTVPRATARRRALANIVDTFFDGSAEKAVAALLDLSRSDLSDADLEHLGDVIERAKREGR